MSTTCTKPTPTPAEPEKDQLYNCEFFDYAYRRTIFKNGVPRGSEQAPTPGELEEFHRCERAHVNYLSSPPTPDELEEFHCYERKYVDRVFWWDLIEHFYPVEATKGNLDSRDDDSVERNDDEDAPSTLTTVPRDPEAPPTPEELHRYERAHVDYLGWIKLVRDSNRKFAAEFSARTIYPEETAGGSLDFHDDNVVECDDEDAASIIFRISQEGFDIPC
jgi:hypothetical protein